MWIIAPKGAKTVNWTSATDCQLAVRRDNMISISSVKSFNVDFLNQIRYFLIE